MTRLNRRSRVLIYKHRREIADCGFSRAQAKSQRKSLLNSDYKFSLDDNLVGSDQHMVAPAVNDVD